MIFLAIDVLFVVGTGHVYQATTVACSTSGSGRAGYPSQRGYRGVIRDPLYSFFSIVRNGSFFIKFMTRAGPCDLITGMWVGLLIFLS